MRVASRIWLLLAAFLLVAGGVYLLTSHEYAGGSLLLVGAATFAYMAVVGWSLEHAAEESHGAGEPEVEVPPTIWPFGLAIAGLILLVGFVVSRWILVAGVVAFAVAAAGWLRQVLRSHASERS
jgi:Cytochrome c oxidase subunit IV